MFTTVSLPRSTWQSILRRLTSEVGADDESRKWAAAAIQEQVSGAVKVKASRSGSVEMKAGKGGDLRGASALR